MGKIIDKKEAYKKLELLVKIFKDELRNGNISTSYSRTVSNPDYPITETGKKFSETQVRQSFILPMFRDVLGWDVDNSINEVIPEFHNTKGFADFVFVRNNHRKFVLETKKPFVNIDPNCSSGREGVRQAIGYARSLKDVNISLVSNFELLVFCHSYTMPKEGQELKNVLNYIYFEDFLKPENFDVLWDFRFEKANDNNFCAKLLSGVDSKIISKSKTIDENLLDDLKEIRVNIANNIEGVLLTVEEADRLTQFLINRIVLVRVLEDRGIISTKLSEFVDTENVWAKLKKRFVNIYESFPVEILNTSNKSILDSKSLIINDSALSKCIQMFYDRGPEYYHDCYDFKFIPSEILGYAYEHSIAFKLILDKREYKLNKKEFYKNGVHYTPTYVCRNLTRKTIQRSLARNKSKQIENLICMDLACGSGSFLTSIYDELYSQSIKANDSRILEDVALGRKILPLEYRKKILESCIHGIDIDNFAVEVSKLSLLLKYFENFPSSKQFLTNEEIPNIHENIICADSLLDTSLKVKLPKKSKAVGTHFKKIYDIISKKKCDVIVGNPPYIKIQDLLKIDPVSVKLYKELYKKTVEKGAVEFAIPFIERATNLLSVNGEIGFIVPNKIFKNKQGEGLRKLICGKDKNVSLCEFVDFNSIQIFDASIYTCLLHLSSDLSLEKFKCSQIYRLEDGAYILNKLEEIEAKYPSNDYEVGMLSLERLNSSPWKLHVGVKKRIIEKLEGKFNKLKDVVVKKKIFQGIPTGSDKIFILKKIKEKNKSLWEMNSDSLNIQQKAGCKDKKNLKELPIKTVEIEREYLKPLYMGSTDLKHFYKKDVEYYLLYPYDSDGNLIKDKKFFDSKAYQYLNTNLHRKGLKDSKGKTLLLGLDEREDGEFAGKYFYQYSRPQNLDLWSSEKIMFPYLAEHFNAHLADEHLFVNVSTGGYALIPPNNELEKMSLLAVLNSEIFNFLIKSFSGDFRGGWFECSNHYVSEVPVPDITSKSNVKLIDKKSICDDFEYLYETEEELSRTDIDPVTKANLLSEKNITLDRLNLLVKNLYELTNDEWEIIDFYSSNDSDEEISTRFNELKEVVERVETSIAEEFKKAV